ncbi:MAG TPA: diadenylate cyclase CdaA [Gemmatales bacterium]|nr:diadenylate cyclase CdaA [Gemmatales bacterium]HMP59360.1 diadenylate cyclase CdaA [Gemmatales bacterium]
MTERFIHLYESIGRRDLIEIGILSLFIYGILRFIGATRGTSMVRGLGIVVVGFILLVQVIIASFDLAELSKMLDYLLTAVLLSLIVIFQPELRRGLLMLGRYRMFRVFTSSSEPIVDRLAEACVALASEYTGALIVLQRTISLEAYIKTGERLDAEVTAGLLRAIFQKRSPLHDGAVIIVDGRLQAAACQLPLAEAPQGLGGHGMRHRAAMGISEETDALVLVVSEETGRISIAQNGRLEVVSRELVSRRLGAVLHGGITALAA